MSKVDIIIPVHNRPRHTFQTLESLLKNTPPDLYTLNVINDGSDADTSQVVNSAIGNAVEIGIRVPDWNLIIHDAPIGPGASRNEMTKQITDEGRRSEYLYHSDNDVYFIPGWLEELLMVFEHMDKSIKILGASCHPYLQNNERIHAVSKIGSSRASLIGIKDAVSGYSQLMTWETWDKYGPFDETMRGAAEKIMGSEDWAFCQKIIKDGFKVGSIEPEVVIPCGKTNTYGKQATGSETFKNHPGILVW